MRVAILAVLIAVLANPSARAASTVNPNVPATGAPLSSAQMRAQFGATANDINGLESMFKGSVAPTNPLVGQLWANDSVLPYDVRVWDGAQWVVFGTLNPTSHVWGTGAGAGTAVANVWTGLNSIPPCPLTDAATILVSASNCAAGSQFGVGINKVTLTANRNLAFPTGLPATDGFFVLFDINHGSGGFSLSPASGYWFPNQTFTQTTGVPNAIDEFGCWSDGAGTIMKCGSVISALGPSGFIVRANHVRSTTFCQSTTTCSATILNSVAGDLRVVGLFYGKTGVAAANLTTVTDEHGNSCARAAGGVFGTIPGGTRATDIWYCTVAAAAASSTVTATWPSGEDYSELHVVEVGNQAASPDQGIGNFANGTTASVSVSTSGAGVTQAGEFIFTMIKGEGITGPTSAGPSPIVLLDCDGCAGTVGSSPNFDEYHLKVASSGAGTNTATFTAAGGGSWVASIAAFIHK